MKVLFILPFLIIDLIVTLGRKVFPMAHIRG